MSPDVHAAPAPATNGLTSSWRVAAKEFSLFLSSPIGWLFFAAFAAVTLFVVFWAEAFFARNIADVRPMFEWMPLLLIVLCSALTMRMWSEERRTGTLEHIQTQPAPLWSFVLGKFLGCVLLLALALLVLLPLPLSLSTFSDIDWGPVWAGYLATLLLGAAYLSMGLFVSSRTQNQIVSFISAMFLCGLFWLVGQPMITDNAGQAVGELLQSLSTSARFDSITRGVIDMADLTYYLSLTVIFSALTVYSLEKERWAKNRGAPRHRQWKIATVLLVANALVLNVWIGKLDSLRVDVTRGKLYSLSDSTHNYLSQLQEPLLLRGYFSAKTHPLLSPLVPQMRDLLREYEVAGQGRVRVEFIDPQSNAQAEEEANRQYGIEPNPFQVSDRYEASIVSSYFNVLVQYGDEFEVLGFRDLIDVKSRGETDLDVRLRNPEYDLTKSIKRVMSDFQSAGDVFASLPEGVTLTAYLSSEQVLPEELIRFRAEVEQVAASTAELSNGKLAVEFVDPDAQGGAIAQQLAQDYGLRPMSAGLFSPEKFWFHVLLSDAEQLVQLPLGDLTRSEFEASLEAGLKRFAKGFTKRLALVVPASGDFQTLSDFLRNEYDVYQEDLSDGTVAADADLLLLASPADLDEKSLFAVDQFLMQGGTVIAATSPYTASLSQRSLGLKEQTSGLEDWLSHHGLTMAKSLVMDRQNAAFPAPVTRQVGSMQLQEMRMLDYPYFVDIRQSGMNADVPVAASLGQVTMAWSSPIHVAETAERTVEPLLHSSPESWLSESLDVMPRISSDGSSGWQPGDTLSEQLLAVSSQGRFSSYFEGKPSPLLESDLSEDSATDETGESITSEARTEASSSLTANDLDTVIERSPESARIILFSSNDFLRDSVTRMSGAATGSFYLAPFQLMANTVDVALDDTGLLSIRSRGQFNNTLPPMDSSSQKFWESVNYVLAAIVIAAIYLIVRVSRRLIERRQLAWMTS